MACQARQPNQAAPVSFIVVRNTSRVGVLAFQSVCKITICGRLRCEIVAGYRPKRTTLRISPPPSLIQHASSLEANLPEGGLHGIIHTVARPLPLIFPITYHFHVKAGTVASHLARSQAILSSKYEPPRHEGYEQETKR